MTDKIDQAAAFLASQIMADLRQRKGLHEILGARETEGMTWITPDIQNRIENRIAVIVAAGLRDAALEAVICAEANCLTKDAPATHRLRASLTEGDGE